MIYKSINCDLLRKRWIDAGRTISLLSTMQRNIFPFVLSLYLCFSAGYLPVSNGLKRPTRKRHEVKQEWSFAEFMNSLAGHFIATAAEFRKGPVLETTCSIPIQF